MLISFWSLWSLSWFFLFWITSTYSVITLYSVVHLSLIVSVFDKSLNTFQQIVERAPIFWWLRSFRQSKRWWRGMPRWLANRYHETWEQKTVICLTVIHSRHGKGDVDIPYIPGYNENILLDVPVVWPWVQPCCFAPDQESEYGVGHNQVVFWKEFVWVSFANTMATENAIPGMVIPANSGVEVAKNYEVISYCGGSHYWLQEAVERHFDRVFKDKKK